MVGSVEMPCYPSYVCKFQVDCYKGDTRDEEHRLCTIKACQINCHTCYGKVYGCCCDPCRFLDFTVVPGPKSKGKPITIQKEHFGCVNECYTMADKYNFTLSFKEGGKKHAILMAAIQFIDMLYFENNYQGVGGI